MPKRRPDFCPSLAYAETAQLKKFSEPGGAKSGGCPMPAETDSSASFAPHRNLLPNGRLHAKQQTLDKYLEDPSPPDAVVANHAIDDLITGKSRSKNSRDPFFHRDYENTPVSQPSRA